MIGMQSSGVVNYSPADVCCIEMVLDVYQPPEGSANQYNLLKGRYTKYKLTPCQVGK